jgi:hypothetical protein
MTKIIKMIILTQSLQFRYSKAAILHQPSLTMISMIQ